MDLKYRSSRSTTTIGIETTAGRSILLLPVCCLLFIFLKICSFDPRTKLNLPAIDYFKYSSTRTGICSKYSSICRACTTVPVLVLQRESILLVASINSQNQHVWLMTTVVVILKVRHYRFNLARYVFGLFTIGYINTSINQSTALHFHIVVILYCSKGPLRPKNVHRSAAVLNAKSKEVCTTRTVGNIFWRGDRRACCIPRK